MYKLFLTFRYLTRKKIVIFPILVVWLCVMMLIIVTSIMGGFVDRVRDANRDLYGDIIISSPSSSQGFAGYEKLQKELADKFPGEIAASTPVVEAYSLLYVPSVRRSVPALMIGVEPDERSQVTSFRQSLFEQYQAPMQAVDELSRVKLPATREQLVDYSVTHALEAQKAFAAAFETLDKLEHGKIPAETAQLLWLTGLMPLALILALLTLRAGAKGWRLRFLTAEWQKILLAFGAIIIIGLLAWPAYIGLVLLFRSEAGTNVQHIALLAAVGVSAGILASALVALLLLYRTRFGPFYVSAILTTLLGGAIIVLGTLWPFITHRSYDLAEDQSHQAELVFDQAMRTHDIALALPPGTYATRDELLKAIVPRKATFDVPAAATAQFNGEGLPKEGCIVGSQIGFLKRDTRGNFVHDYPTEFRKVSVTVFPPSKSGNINVKSTNAVTQDFTIVDDSHTGVYDVDSLSVYAPFETVQLMAGMRLDPKLQGQPGVVPFEPRCHEILIRLDPKARKDMRMVRAKIDAFTQEFASYYNEDHADAFPYELAVQTWDEKQAKYIGAVQNEKNMMTFILLLMSGVVLVVIFLIFYQIVRDKTRDIGIIKAVGGSELGVAGIFLTYGLLTGIVGGGLGVLSGVLFVTHTNQIHEMIFQVTGIIIWDRSVYLFDRIPDVVRFWDCINYFGVAILAGLFGALIPAVLAAFEDPVQAVRYECLIRLVNIHKTYQMGNTTIRVCGIDLTVGQGEFVAIMGASGSGKSTLLHITGILDRPDTPLGLEPNGRAADAEPASPGAETPQGGEVFFRRQSVLHMGRFAQHRLRNTQIGFVFQFYHLLPELNVLENVLLPAMVEAPFYMAFAGVKPRKERAMALIESFGLSHRIHHRPAQLSGGERQRAAIARALINEPAVLLADEPTGNLDAKTGRTILDVLVRLHKEHGQTMLLVTHDPNVAALADRTVNLVEGRIRN